MSNAKAPAKRPRKASGKSMPSSGRNPAGGLTAKGREFYKQTEGAHLKPGVKGAADTPEKMKRKGSFLTRHFTHPRGPMIKDGKPTRLALSANAWGEPVPSSASAAKKLGAKGRALLKKFHAAQKASSTNKS